MGHVRAVLLAVLCLTHWPWHAHTQALNQSTLTCTASALTETLQPWRCPAIANASMSSLSLAQTCSATALASTVPVLSLMVGSEQVYPAYVAAVRRYNATRPAGAWAVDIRKRPPQGSLLLSNWDVFVGSSVHTGDLFAAGQIATLDGSLLSARGTVNDDWLAIDPVLRTQVSTYGKAEVCGVTNGGPSHLFYRHDILARAGVSPNALSTWGGVLTVAQNLTGKDWDGDGVPEYGFCFNRLLDGAVAALIQMTGPLVQTKGPNEGYFIDAATGKLLLTTAGARLAYMIYQRLQAMAPPNEAFVRDIQPNDSFLIGRCVITLSASPVSFKTYSQSRLSRVRGKFSALPTPGSDIVLNRASNTLVPCDRVSCPMANLEPEPLDSTAPAKLHINYTQLLGLNDTTRAMLNMGPGQDLISGPMLNRLVYYTFPEAFYISSRLPKDGKVQAMRLFEYLTNSNNSWSIILDPNTDITPYRKEHYSAIGGANPATRWALAGYDPAGAASYLSALNRTMAWGKNVAGALKFPGRNTLLAAVTPITAEIGRGISAVEYADRVVAVFNQTAIEIYGSVEAFVQAYKESISYVDVPRQTIRPPLPVAPTPSPTNHFSHRGIVTLTASLSALVPVALILAGCCIVWSIRMKRKHMDLFARVRFPPLAPDTTLLVAAIQDFDILGEHCESDVCDAAMGIWNDFVTTLLKKHMGYKVHTSTPECLRAAFHTPADAACFALALNDQLLQAKWPKQLLSVPEFEPTYMTPVEEARAVEDGMRVNLHASTTEAATSAQPATSAKLPKLGTRSHGYSLGGYSHHVGDISTFRTFRDYLSSQWEAKTLTSHAHKLYRRSRRASTGGVQPGTMATPPDSPFWRPALSKRSTISASGFPQAAEQLADSAVLVSAGLQVCVSMCAIGRHTVVLDVHPFTGDKCFVGTAVDIIEYMAVSATCGGVVLLPQHTYNQLPIEVMSDKYLFTHWGEYQLTEDLLPLDIYLALPRPLFCRLGTLQPLRVHQGGKAMAPGVLSAPMERAAMVFTYVVGMQTLTDWNYDLASHITQVFARLASSLLTVHNGYLVEQVPGFMLSAFQDAADAVLWATHLQDLMMLEMWSEDLLSHELCEEVYVGTTRQHDASATSDSRFLPQSPYKAWRGGVLVHRGPRLKSGISFGPCLAALNTVTGRMAYRGKVMNRAARVASLASSGQVVCSSEVLFAAGGAQGVNARQADRAQPTSTARQARDSAGTEVASTDMHTGHTAQLQRLSSSVYSSSYGGERALQPARPVHVSSLGLVTLKGIADQIEVFVCRAEPGPPPITGTDAIVLEEEGDLSILQIE